MGRGTKRPTDNNASSTNKKIKPQELVPLPRFWQSIEDAWAQVPGDSNKRRLKLVATLRNTVREERQDMANLINETLMLPFLEAILRTYTLDELLEWIGHLNTLMSHRSLHDHCDRFCEHNIRRNCLAYIVSLGEKVYYTVAEYPNKFWVDKPFLDFVELLRDVKSYIKRKPYMQQNQGAYAPTPSTSGDAGNQVKKGTNHATKNALATAPSSERRVYNNEVIADEDFWASIKDSWSVVDRKDSRAGLLDIQTVSARCKLAQELPMSGMIAALQVTLDSFTYGQIRDWERHLKAAKTAIEDQVKEVFDDEHDAHAFFVIACGKEYYDVFKNDPVTFHVKVTSDALGSLPSQTIVKNFGARFLKYSPIQPHGGHWRRRVVPRIKNISEEMSSARGEYWLSQVRLTSSSKKVRVRRSSSKSGASDIEGEMRS